MSSSISSALESLIEWVSNFEIRAEAYKDEANSSLSVSSKLSEDYRSDIERCSNLVELSFGVGSSIPNFVSEIDRNVTRVKATMARYVQPALDAFLRADGEETFHQFIQRLLIDGSLLEIGRAQSWKAFWLNLLGEDFHNEGSLPHIAYDSPRPYSEREARVFYRKIADDLPNFIRQFDPASVIGGKDDLGSIPFPVAQNLYYAEDANLDHANTAANVVATSEVYSADGCQVTSESRCVHFNFLTPGNDRYTYVTVPIRLRPGHVVLSRIVCDSFSDDGAGVLNREPQYPIRVGAWNVANGDIVWAPVNELNAMVTVSGDNAVVVCLDSRVLGGIGLPIRFHVYIEIAHEYYGAPSVPIITYDNEHRQIYSYTATPRNLASFAGSMSARVVDLMTGDLRYLWNIMELYDAYLIRRGLQEYTYPQALVRWAEAHAYVNVPTCYHPATILCGKIYATGTPVHSSLYYTFWFTECLKRLRLAMISIGFRDYYISLGFQ
jgi:hypothetical protein